MKCCQCGNQAVIQYQFGLLCLDHHLKFVQAADIQISQQERMMNFLLDEMEATVGIRLGGGRFPERKPPILHTGKIDMKPIILNNSVVGNINTGVVNSLNANLQNITLINQDYAEKIKNFVEAAASDENITQKQKEEILESIDYLSQQLQTQNKNKSVIKSVVSSIANIVNVSASLHTLWTTLSPIFSS